MYKTFRQSLKKILRPWLMPFALRALQSKASEITTIEDAVSLAIEFSRLGTQIPLVQVREEISQFLLMLKQHPPATVLEIGTAGGGTFFLLTRVATQDALLFSLDLPAGQLDAYPVYREALYRGFGRERQRIELIREDSHDPRTLEKVCVLLQGRQLDLLFIDGDHSYQGVKKDFEMYSSLVSQNGIIAFHDIVPGPEVNVGGVPQFWLEIKQTRPTIEFVKNWEQGGWGIGVLPSAGTGSK